MPVAKWILTAPADDVTRTLGGRTGTVAVYDHTDLRERLEAAWASRAQVILDVTPEYARMQRRCRSAGAALLIAAVACVGLTWWAETAGVALLTAAAGAATLLAMAGSVVLGIVGEQTDPQDLVAEVYGELDDEGNDRP